MTEGLRERETVREKEQEAERRKSTKESPNRPRQSGRVELLLSSDFRLRSPFLSSALILPIQTKSISRFDTRRFENYRRGTTDNNVTVIESLIRIRGDGSPSVRQVVT